MWYYYTIALQLLLHVVGAHEHTAYKHNEGPITYRGNWMAAIPNLTPLWKLSIPGTHDSLATNGGWQVQTQSMTFQQQLDGGIRAFDVRLRQDQGNVLPIYHGCNFLDISFGTVLQQAIEFLRNHETEFLIMRIKIEKQRHKDSGKPFEQLFDDHVRGYARNFIYWPHPDQPLDIKVGQLRRKILFLDEITLTYSNFTIYGMPWDHQGWMNHIALAVQDVYKIGGYHDLYRKKWAAAKPHFEAANRNTGPTVYVNFLSGAGFTHYPWFVASGHVVPANGGAREITTAECSTFPDFACINGIAYAEGTNIMAYEHSLDHISTAGIVFMDFPGDGIVGRIISLNPSVVV